ncbi:MAG: MFS transporter, partial [Syntrophales bacterium LBB04]|nr:MFS transporter [Syntrophales bacterium LBB04]
GLLGCLMAFIIIKESGGVASLARTIRRFDYFGALLVAVILTSLLLSITLAQRGLVSPLLVGAGFALSLLALAIFLFWQSQAEEPLVDLKLFKNRLFSAGNAARVFGFAAVGANTLAMPFYLQLAMGYSPFTSGMMMSATGMGMAICAPISGWIADRTGERLVASFGLTLNVLAFFLLAFFTPKSYAAIITLLAMMGVGWGIFQAPNVSSVMNAVPKDKYGIASGLTALSRDLGQVSGVAMATAFLVMGLHSATGSASLEGLKASVVNSQARNQLLSAFLGGFRFAYLAAGLLCLAAMVATLIGAGGKKSDHLTLSSR